MNVMLRTRWDLGQTDSKAALQAKLADYECAFILNDSETEAENDDLYIMGIE